MPFLQFSVQGLNQYKMNHCPPNIKTIILGLFLTPPGPREGADRDPVFPPPPAETPGMDGPGVALSARPAQQAAPHVNQRLPWNSDRQRWAAGAAGRGPRLFRVGDPPDLESSPLSVICPLCSFWQYLG